MRSSDWLPVRTGDRVFDPTDPRHVGRVEAVHHGAFVTVTWEETGWKSELPLRSVRRAPAE